jgi:tRNA threonylcarbamoyladenosine biosynthesis protein TsaE
MNLKIITNAPEETVKLGSKLSNILNIGDLIFLVGDLGAGKTTFISGVAKGLKIKNDISSPSFTLINEYDLVKNNLPIKFFHCDFYRINNLEEILDIGIEDYIYNKNSIIFIEWGTFLKQKISKDFLEIRFEYYFNNNSNLIEKNQDLSQKRKITFVSNNKYWNSKLKLFKEQIEQINLQL